MIVSNNNMTRANPLTSQKTSKYAVILLITIFAMGILISSPARAEAALDVSCSPDISAIYDGESVSWSADVSGGDGNYTYEWSDDQGNSSSDENFDQSYNAGSGNETISVIAEVTVTDGLGDTGSSQCEVIVIGELTFNGCEANEVSGETGVPIKWTADVVGGLTPYTLSWSGDDDLSGDSTRISKNYSTPGTKSAFVDAVSSDDGQIVVGPFDCGSVEIYPTPGEFIVSCRAEPDNPKQFASVTWVADVSGGLEPYTFSWDGDNNLSGDGETVVTSYTEVGVKNATLNVISSDGQMATGVSCSLEVEERTGGGGHSGNDDDGGDSSSTSTTTDSTSTTTDSTSTSTEPTSTTTESTSTTTSEEPGEEGSGGGEIILSFATPGTEASSNLTATGTQDGTDSQGTTTDATSTATTSPEQLASGLTAAAFAAFVGDNLLWFGFPILLLIILAIIFIAIVLKRRSKVYNTTEH